MVSGPEVGTSQCDSKALGQEWLWLTVQPCWVVAKPILPWADQTFKCSFCNPWSKRTAQTLLVWLFSTPVLLPALTLREVHLASASSCSVVDSASASGDAARTRDKALDSIPRGLARWITQKNKESPPLRFSSAPRRGHRSPGPREKRCRTGTWRRGRSRGSWARFEPRALWIRVCGESAPGRSGWRGRPSEKRDVEDVGVDIFVASQIPACFSSLFSSWYILASKLYPLPGSPWKQKALSPQAVDPRNRCGAGDFAAGPSCCSEGARLGTGHALSGRSVGRRALALTPSSAPALFPRPQHFPSWNFHCSNYSVCDSTCCILLFKKFNLNIFFFLAKETQVHQVLKPCLLWLSNPPHHRALRRLFWGSQGCFETRRELWVFSDLTVARQGDVTSKPIYARDILKLCPCPYL